MSKKRRQKSTSEMSLSEEQSKRPDSPVFSSVSLKSDHSKGDVPNLSEETPAATKSDRSGSPGFSSVSLKSDHSKGDVPNFSEETPPASKSEKPGSPGFSSVSLKSDHSKGDVPNFSEETPSVTKSDRSGSPGFSSVFLKSDHSKGDVPNFSEETPSATKSFVSVKSDISKGDVPNFSEEAPSATKRPGSHVSNFSCVKSEHSKGDVPNFSEETPAVTKSERPDSHVVSMKSDHSKGDVPNFSEKTLAPTKSNQWQKNTVNIGSEFARWKTLKAQKGLKSDEEVAFYLLNRIQCDTSDSDLKIQRRRKDFKEKLLSIFQDLENKIITFLKNELEKFKKIIKKENTQYFVKDLKEDRYNVKEAALDITLYFLRSMKQNELADTLEDELVFIYQRQLKSNLKKKYQCVFEGIAKHGDSTLLNKIYTDLYITQGSSEQVNTEHEVRQMEKASRHPESPEKPIKCTSLFKPPGQDKEIRTVLTKGVAGIGKSVSVQKFVLDWAEGNENQDISFIFPLPFREMNLKENDRQSLMDLISQFFPETKGLNLARNDKFKVLFVLDGLDECRLPLKFEGNETWRDVTSPASLDVLLTNLIKGNLLPSAHIWITTRPAAASKIPPEYIDLVAEVRGFDDPQKEEYFKKRFTDEKLANTIIDHVKKSKSLFIMCHIPVFCWISATVLQNILEKKRNDDEDQADDTPKTLQESGADDEIPKTLTQMYTYFFRFQIQQSSRKYDGKYSPDISWDKEAILSLGKLAFHQLERNNLIFYGTDLEDCGIDPSKASVYSGMCTQMFKEEKGIVLGTTYCFVHMSIQEFIASLYAHLFLDSNKTSAFFQESTEPENKNETMTDLLKTAVDKALASDNGHLDLFLRFLLGLSLESNRPLLQGLLKQEDHNKQSKTEIVEYIKQKFEDNASPERSINLFYCLNELNDQTLVKQIQNHLREGSLSSADLSPAQWSALAFVLLTSEEELEEFELQKFKKSDECLCRLVQVVKTAKRALLNDCDLTDKSCSALSTVLRSETNLKELNMNNNNLQDSGVKLLCTGLESIKCKLEILRLSKCKLTEESCSALAAVLSSDSSSLRELDLSNNTLKDSGVKLLSVGLKSNCKLEILTFSDCSITEEGYKSLASALKSNPSHLIELDLRGNDPGESGVKMLYDLLKDPNCKLKLRFLKSEAAEKTLKYWSEVLGENPLLLREMNLSEYKLGDSEVNQLASLLEDKHCKVNKLILNNNYITEEGCGALASAFNLNPSNLKELDLSGNKLRDSGMKNICTLFKNVQCRLVKLKFNLISITNEGCTALASALNSNPSNIRELDLSENNLGDSGVMEISTLLKNSECRLEKLRMSECSITEEGYIALTSALKSNPSHLVELDLRGNDPGESGVELLTDLLQDPECKLTTLRFLKSATAEEGYQFLTEDLGKNPLLTRKLDLSGHNLRDTRVKQIAALLGDKHCKLNIIQLNNNCITEEDCGTLVSAFNSNPSNLKELDLSGNKIRNSGVEKISTLLKNTQFKLEKLKMSECSISEEGYKSLSLALRSNPSHLIELDLSGNDPGESGVELLSDLLQNGHYKLNTLRFLKSPAAEEACEQLAKVLRKNPLLLKELDLSHNKLGDLDGEKLSALLIDSHSKLVKMKLNNCDLTEKSCSTLATVLSSDTVLKEIDLNNSSLMDSGVKQICKGLMSPLCKLNILKLSKCELTEESCSALAAVLSSDSSSLRVLDLSNNNLQDLGVKLLSDGLESNCKLEILILSNCSITEEGYKTLASALKSNLSHLKELNVSGNDPGESGVELLCNIQQGLYCKLKTLRFLKSPTAEEAYRYFNKVIGKNALLLRALNLSGHKLGDSRVNQLTALLEDKHCKLNILQLNNNCITEESCGALVSAFNSNPSNLKELDLSGNIIRNSGMKKICSLFGNPQFKLEKLKMSDCSVTEEGYKALSSALKSNLSHLIELDLRENDPGESGVKLLNDLLQDGCCKLKFIRYLKSSDAEEACEHLTKILGINPLLLKELDLSHNKLENFDELKLSDMLKDSHSKLDKIMLSNCDLTEKSCSALASVLSSNAILKEIDLNNSPLKDSGVKRLCEGLKKSQCKLKRLKLSNCSITEEGYKSLSLALKSNPSHLIELDLRGNDPGESGVKLLYDLLQDTKCKLKLRLLQSPSAEDACQYLTSVLQVKYSLLLRELNLCGHKLEDSRVNELAALLEDKHCKLNKLQLSNCITGEDCGNLVSALNSNPSNLKELDLSGNKLGNSGMKKICTLLKNTQVRLEKLRLSECSITEDGYKALSSALRSNPSHLIELDLSGNDPGESGVELLYDLLQDRQCKLKNLRLLKRHSAEEAHQYWTKKFGKNPLLLREWNLNGYKLGDAKVKELAALLGDKHCKLNKLLLSECKITEKCSHDLASALSSNILHLKELDLSKNKLGNTGVKHFGAVLRNSDCKLEKLWLKECDMTDEGCSALTSALNSNPSHLRHLNLSGNKLGDSGVGHLCDLLRNYQCQLEKLEMCECSITEKQCGNLTSALCSNLSYLRELSLSGNKLKDSGLQDFCNVLKHSHCKLEKLSLNKCDITDVASLAKTKAVCLLKELDLSNNKIGDSKQLQEVVKGSNCNLKIDSGSWWPFSTSKKESVETTKQEGNKVSPSPEGVSKEKEDQEGPGQRTDVSDQKGTTV
ncbi:protein NLRC5-like isoform X2 [Myxocyprinus asiaticus]|uniref:protein NLRC5-like isoform X2 n=1 Tax=Myxocyprinus asiaticus TaxID=70543 RepID=UPI0022232132|nr:protein NLRC5-like isoform X2 [Myxocyprinus asiaticus]